MRKTITKIEFAVSRNQPITKWENARLRRARLRAGERPIKTQDKPKPASAPTVEDLAAKYNVRV